jgi:glucose-6-phosphate dehydrogenase assembly protein OpcA
VLDGLGDRVPSRTIMLLPDLGSARDALDAEVDLRCSARGGRGQAVCSEVIAIWLRGGRARAPASVVQPLLVSDLPAFLRWRGALPYGAPELEQLLDVVDRLVVSGREWDDPAVGYRSLRGLFDRVAVSDLAWALTRPWREAIAALWPKIAAAEEIRVAGPAADALLLAGWLRSRLRREVRLAHELADELELVEVDGHAAETERSGRQTPSDVLSDQLEVYTRDPVYEEAVAAAS